MTGARLEPPGRLVAQPWQAKVPRAPAVHGQPAGMPQILSATMKLPVREWGTGDRVAVLIHGITSDSTGWRLLGPDLASAATGCWPPT